MSFWSLCGPWTDWFLIRALKWAGHIWQGRSLTRVHAWVLEFKMLGAGGHDESTSSRASALLYIYGGHSWRAVNWNVNVRKLSVAHGDPNCCCTSPLPLSRVQ